MDLFSNKTVVGLFDNQEDLGQALSNLHKQGFGKDEDDLVLINENNLTGTNPFIRSGKQFIVTPTSSSGAGGAIPTDTAIPEDNVSEIALEEKLTDLGIDEQEASFYARQINRGNTLLVVETDDDKAPQVHDIMRRFNAKSSIS